VAFSRDYRRTGTEDGSDERDRHSIVGLSGWLFADLLLAVAVIFLVANEPPKFSDDAEAVNSVAAEGVPTAALSFEPELPTNESGLPIWRENDVSESEFAEIGIRVVFSELVSGFGDDLEDLSKDVMLTAFIDGERKLASDTGWSVRSLRPIEPGRAWLLKLSPVAGFKSSIMEVTLRQGAVIDRDRNPNPEPKALSFQVQRRPDTVIDTKKASQIVVRARGQSCDPTSKDSIESLSRSIRDVQSFILNVASKKEDRVTKRETFVNWVLSPSGFGANPRVGFAFIYGPGDKGDVIAGNWRACTVKAFESLGWLSAPSPEVSELPMKFFDDFGITRDQLKIEMYFFSALGSSK
jgi:hypothetical protein